MIKSVITRISRIPSVHEEKMVKRMIKKNGKDLSFLTDKSKKRESRRFFEYVGKMANADQQKLLRSVR